MNKFLKYAAGVYVMKSDDNGLQPDAKAIVKTRNGKEVAVRIWKKVRDCNDGGAIYSFQREDGMCSKQRLLNKAAKRKNWAESASAKADDYYAKSNEHREFLVLGEPIKVGHHSEKRHRKIIEDSNKNMGKCVEMHEKMEHHEEKAEALERAAKNIFIDVPECLEQLEKLIDETKDYIAEAKAEKEGRFIISNANATRRRYEKRLEIAKKLWEL